MMRKKVRTIPQHKRRYGDARSHSYWPMKSMETFMLLCHCHGVWEQMARFL